MNYFEHEKNVLFVDGLLSHSQDWQWLVDYIERKYVFKEPTSWSEFVHDSNSMLEIIKRFSKIKKVYENGLAISNPFVNDAWLLSSYSLGIIEKENCLSKISTLTGKIVFVCLFVTKLINVENDRNDEFNIRVFQERNYYQICSLKKVELNIDYLRSLLDPINLDGIEIAKDIFWNNILEKNYYPEKDFFIQVSNRSESCAFFNFETIPYNAEASWQEHLVRTITEYSLREADESGLVWGYSQDEIVRAQNDLNNNDVTFILDTILFYGFHVNPSPECMQRHCKIVGDKLKTNCDLFELLQSPSCIIISKGFQLRLQGEWKKSEIYKEMIRLFQVYKEPHEIRAIIKMGLPISKEQDSIYKAFCETKYKYISEIKELYQLRDYFEDDDVICSIDKEFFCLVSKRFDELLESVGRNILIANAFYGYMLFLIRVNKKNEIIDHRLIQPEMLRIKELWTSVYYEKVVSEMQVFSYERSIPNEAVEKYNNQVLANPILLSNSFMPYKEDSILEYMMSASDNPFSIFSNRIEIAHDYPKKGGQIIYAKHDIDKAFLEIVTEIKERKGYKLRNKLKPEEFVVFIYERYRRDVQTSVSMFHKEEELYNEIRKNAEIKLLDYTEQITMAMLLQLFPLLEIKIRRFASLFGIFPYKMSENEFMQSNDPSSLLRELLLQLYSEQKSFENVSDLMFVYNMMYNSNMVNIRNECVHGRAYLSGGEARYAFRVTIICIHMIMFRIKTIEENLSDLV